MRRAVTRLDAAGDPLRDGQQLTDHGLVDFSDSGERIDVGLGTTPMCTAQNGRVCRYARTEAVSSMTSSP